MSLRTPCLGLVLAAVHAAGQGLPAPPPQGGQSRTWRESIDQGRDRLADQLLGIKLSAFGDGLFGPDDQGRKKLDWGALELDLAGEFHENLEAAFAVVSTQEATQLAVGFLDWHPFGGTIAPRGRLWVEKGFHVQVGRFDVPFGSDWQYFASKDSVSISRPFTTSAIMDGGYNDLGIRVLGNDGEVNFNAFALKGFDEGRLIGGRIGITPLGNPFSLRDGREPKAAEFGLSVLYDMDRFRRKQEVAWATDAEGRMGPFFLRGEYLWRRREASDQAEGFTKHGWHLTQELGFPEGPLPTTFFLRYERMSQLSSDPAPGDERDARMALGAAAVLAGIVQVKVEWQHTFQATAATREAPGYSANVLLAQVVVVL